MSPDIEESDFKPAVNPDSRPLIWGFPANIWNEPKNFPRLAAMMANQCADGICLPATPAHQVKQLKEMAATAKKYGLHLCITGSKDGPPAPGYLDSVSAQMAGFNYYVSVARNPIRDAAAFPPVAVEVIGHFIKAGVPHDHMLRGLESAPWRPYPDKPHVLTKRKLGQAGLYDGQHRRCVYNCTGETFQDDHIKGTLKHSDRYAFSLEPAYDWKAILLAWWEGVRRKRGNNGFLGDILIVDINSESDIEALKGVAEAVSHYGGFAFNFDKFPVPEPGSTPDPITDPIPDPKPDPGELPPELAEKWNQLKGHLQAAVKLQEEIETLLKK